MHYSVRWAGRGDWKNSALFSQVSQKRWLKEQCIIQSGEPEEVIERTALFSQVSQRRWLKELHYSVRWARGGDWKNCIIQSGEPEEVIERTMHDSVRWTRRSDWKDNALFSQVSQKRWLKGQFIFQPGKPERGDTFRLQVHLLHGVGPPHVGPGCGHCLYPASTLLPSQGMDLQGPQASPCHLCWLSGISGGEPAQALLSASYLFHTVTVNVAIALVHQTTWKSQVACTCWRFHVS